MTELFLARHRFSTGRTGSCRLYNNHISNIFSRTRQGHSRSPVSNVWPRCMISEGNHVKFARFVLPGRPAVSQWRRKNMTSRFASLTEEDIEKMVEDKDSQNTKICRQIGNKIDTQNFVVLETLLRFENCSSSHCLLSSCRRIPHFIVLFSSGQRWLLVRGVAMGLCRRCVIFMSSCPRTLLPCHLATLLPCYLVTLLPCYLVTLLPCYLVFLLPCYLVTLLP